MQLLEIEPDTQLIEWPLIAYLMYYDQAIMYCIRYCNSIFSAIYTQHTLRCDFVRMHTRICVIGRWMSYHVYLQYKK